MIRSLKDLLGYGTHATDGDVGEISDFLFDDHRWVVRYLVVETGILFDSRQVLLSPIAVRSLDAKRESFELALTMEKVRNSPGIDYDAPVSRQHERDYYTYFGYPHYWGGSSFWGQGSSPTLLTEGEPWDPTAVPAPEQQRVPDANLRSAAAVRGYHVLGTDAGVGHVDDYLIDDETWALRYLVIDTSNWWFGKKVLIDPSWVSQVSWEQRTIMIDLDRATIQKSPPWHPHVPIDRAYEVQLFEALGHAEPRAAAAAPEPPREAPRP
jgi:hypothetical protein